MDKLPIFYSFRRCPYAMRARLFIKLCQINVEIREVHLKSIPLEMIKISPKATVPVLHLFDGTVLEESLHIIDWAIEINDQHDLKKSKLQNHEKTQKILIMMDSSFKDNLDKYKYNSRYKNIQSPEHYRDKATELLYIIEKELSSKRSWIFTNKPSYLDLSILPFIRQFRIADKHWFDNEMPLKQVRDWLMHFLEWSTFQDIMKKNKIWETKDRPIYFGK
jgi:glutathione S-transferase